MVDPEIRVCFIAACSDWQRCRVHHRCVEGFAYASNLLQAAPKAQQEMVAAARRSPSNALLAWRSFGIW